MANIPIEVNTGETKTITFHTAGTFNTDNIVFSISSAGDDANTTMSGIAYCETTGSTAAKTATMPGFELVTGQRIFLQTTKKNTATSNVTLSVNGTEAKPIKIGTADVTSSNLTAGWWVANYDGTNWVLTSIKLTDNNTDTKVKQDVLATDNYRKILLGYNSSTETGAETTSVTNIAYVVNDVEVQPSSGTILANRFVKNGGTESQFLKADGSVDEHTYSLSSHDHSGVYKPIQTAVSDPTASTATSTTFIDSITQNENGVITATKKTLPEYLTAVSALSATPSASLSSNTLTFKQFSQATSAQVSAADSSTKLYFNTAPSLDNKIATMSDVTSAFQVNDAMIFKGTLGTNGTVTALPTTHYQGWTYKVITAGTWAGVTCEVGDMIICITDGTSANNDHWTVVQSNVDGIVTGPASSTSGNIVTFNGTTGKLIQDSGLTIEKSVPSDAEFTDTKVTQTVASASSYTNWRPLVIGNSNSATEGFTPNTTTDTTYTFNTLTCQPSSGTIRAKHFKVIGGTSSQFLKADGSVDENSYASSSHSHTFSSITSRGEAYLVWGGKNLVDSYAPIDAAMVGLLSANRTAFVSPNAVTVEYSRDGGTTWTDYGASDLNKRAFFTDFHASPSFIIGKSTASNPADADCQLRVTLSTSGYNVYTELNKFIIYVSTSSSNGCWCSIDARLQSNVTSNTDTWTNFANKVSISGWSGYNVINTSNIRTYGNIASSQYGQVRFTFGCTGRNTSYNGYSGLAVYGVNCYGGVGWATPSTMASNGRLYTFDMSKNATFPANITATQFVKSDGTSSQFLKADGSVDEHTYSVSTHNHDDSYSPLNHVHAFSDLSSTPTTISGYGITDAKIDGNDVVLGSNTLTVLTSSSSLDATKLTGTVPTSSYIDTDYVFVCSTAASTAAKTATSKSTYELVSKRYYYVYISNSNTKNRALTFNPNSSGAKPIYIDGVASGENNYTLPKGLYHVYYDGTNWYFNPDGSISCSGVRVADNTGFLKADGSIDNSNYITANNLVTINNQSLIGTGNITIQGGGSGGTSDYTQLSNLPSINGTTLTGNVNLATPEQLASKQATLVSGTNIKTINGESILGSGDICPESITIDDTTYTIDTLTGNKIYTFTNPLTSLTIVAYGDTSLETILYFTTGTGFMFGVPNGTRYIIESPIFNEGMSYVVSIKDGTIVMGEIE